LGSRGDPEDAPPGLGPILSIIAFSP